MVAATEVVDQAITALVAQALAVVLARAITTLLIEMGLEEVASTLKVIEVPLICRISRSQPKPRYLSPDLQYCPFSGT